MTIQFIRTWPKFKSNGAELVEENGYRLGTAAVPMTGAGRIVRLLARAVVPSIGTSTTNTFSAAITMANMKFARKFIAKDTTLSLRRMFVDQ